MAGKYQVYPDGNGYYVAFTFSDKVYPPNHFATRRHFKDVKDARRYAQQANDAETLAQHLITDEVYAS